MRKLILLFITIGLMGCSHTLNSYNLRDQSDIYMNFFIYETVNFLKKEKAPGPNKLVIVSTNKQKFTTEFLQILRESGYSIKEISNKEQVSLKFEANEFLISFYIDYISFADDESIYIGLQLTIGDEIYSKIYKSDDISDIPVPLGNWSVRS